MPSDIRIAVPPELLPAAEAARLRQPQPQRVRLVGATAAADARLEARALRLLRERHPALAPEALAARLRQSSVQALLLGLDRAADAVLIGDGDGGDWAWQSLQSGGAAPCGEVWIGETPGGDRFGWADWPGCGEVSAAADTLRAAVTGLAEITGAATELLLVTMESGPDPAAPARERLLATLEARLPVTRAALYSPLLFRDGRLQALAWLDAARAAQRAPVQPKTAVPPLPLLCVPRLTRAEFAPALLAAGCAWLGPFRAGAEVPAARLRPGDQPASAAATLAHLAQWAAARRCPERSGYPLPASEFRP